MGSHGSQYSEVQLEVSKGDPAVTPNADNPMSSSPINSLPMAAISSSELVPRNSQTGKVDIFSCLANVRILFAVLGQRFLACSDGNQN